MKTGAPHREISTGDQTVTGAATGGIVHRVMMEVDEVCLIKDTTGTIASVKGLGSDECRFPFTGQLTINVVTGPVTLVWS